MDKTAKKFRSNLIGCYTYVYATEKQRLMGKIFGGLFFLPYIMMILFCVSHFVPSINRNMNVMYDMCLVIVCALCFAISYPYIKKRREDIENEFLKDESGYKKVELIKVENFMEFPDLEDDFAFMFPAEQISHMLLSDIYTWFRNLNLLKEDTLKIYTFSGKQMREKYDYKVPEYVTVLFVPMKDLCMDENNREKYIEQSPYLLEGKKPDAVIQALKKCKRV